MMVLSRYYLPVARKPSAPARAVADLIEQVGRFAHTDAFIEGLNPAQWATLRYVGRANRFSRTVCAFALFHGTTRGTASQTVKALVEKGYLRRRPVKGDRRSSRLELTVKARRSLTQDPFQDLVNAAGALSAAGRSTVAEGLRVMLESLLMERGLLTPREHMDRLHTLFTIFLGVFEKYHIFTLAMSGTLLGIVRHRDYIPWDDDVDMAVNFSDYDRIMELNTLLNPRGIEISAQGGPPWRPGAVRWRILKFRYRDDPHIFIDLFPFEFKGHTYRMPPGGHVPKSWYQRNVFKVNEIFPVRLMKLRDLWVPCPNKAEGFVARSYGEEAFDTCVVTHQHLPRNQKGILARMENSVCLTRS